MAGSKQAKNSISDLTGLFSSLTLVAEKLRFGLMGTTVILPPGSAEAAGQVPADLIALPEDLTDTFARAAGRIHGTLVPMTDAEVETLKAETLTRLHGMADEAIAKVVGDDPGKKLVEAMHEYVVALSRAREKIARTRPEVNAPLTRLEEMALCKPKEIKEATAELLSGIKTVEKALKNALKESKPRHDPDAVTTLFGDRDRLYFRLQDDSASAVMPFVADVLRTNGYTITDYKGGYATNDGGKNIRKIGRLLAVFDDVPPGLATAYEKDPCRYNKGLAVVVTRDAVDIARGSHGRGWQSCRADDHSAASNGAREHGAGVIAAYLTRSTDLDLHDPLGRVYLKPFDGEGNKTVYFTFNPIGLHAPAFVDAVNRLADVFLNGNKFGKFSLRDGCESYREQQTRTRLPQDAAAALDQLRIPYKKSKGIITVQGDVKLADLGLSALPDFRDVVVKGGMDISNNKLLSLEGLPGHPLAWLKARGTLISSFAGCTPEINGTFNYDWSAYLETSYGAPKAAKYMYSGGHFGSDHKASDDVVCPLMQPDQFPRFKRA